MSFFSKKNPYTLSTTSFGYGIGNKTLASKIPNECINNLHSSLVKEINYKFVCLIMVVSFQGCALNQNFDNRTSIYCSQISSQSPFRMCLNFRGLKSSFIRQFSRVLNFLFGSIASGCWQICNSTCEYQWIIKGYHVLRSYIVHLHSSNACICTMLRFCILIFVVGKPHAKIS